MNETLKTPDTEFHNPNVSTHENLHESTQESIKKSRHEPSVTALKKWYKIYGSKAKPDSTQTWDVIVVGSGMGGMSCAAALAHFGKRVLLLEQHYMPGGFTHMFSRKGYTWDVGVHCVGQMSERQLPGRLIRWLSRNQIEFVPMGNVYETFHYPDGSTIRFPDRMSTFKQTLMDAFPAEKTAIEKYFEAVTAATRDARTFFLMRTFPRWIDDLSTQFSLRTGLGKRHFSKNWWRKTTEEVLDSITTNEKLKAVLTSQWGYYGSTPSRSSFALHALTVRHFWNGGYYPKDGAASIALGLLPVIAEAGGETWVRASVREVLVEDGKAVGVRMEDGTELRASSVVSAVGAKATVERLLPETEREARWARKISDLPQSLPHVCLHLGFEGDVLKAGATKSNQWFM